MLKKWIKTLFAKLFRIFLQFAHKDRINLLSEDIRKIGLIFLGTGLVEFLSDKVNHLTRIESVKLFLLGLLLEAIGIAIFVTKGESKENQS